MSASAASSSQPPAYQSPPPPPYEPLTPPGDAQGLPPVPPPAIIDGLPLPPPSYLDILRRRFNRLCDDLEEDYFGVRHALYDLLLVFERNGIAVTWGDVFTGMRSICRLDDFNHQSDAELMCPADVFNTERFTDDQSDESDDSDDGSDLKSFIDDSDVDSDTMHESAYVPSDYDSDACDSDASTVIFNLNRPSDYECSDTELDDDVVCLDDDDNVSIASTVCYGVDPRDVIDLTADSDDE